MLRAHPAGDIVAAMCCSLPTRTSCLLLFVAGLMLAGCQTAATSAGPACVDPAVAAVRVELFFGRGISGGGEVSEAEWQAFLDGEVTPRFPEGLTVVDLTGQWRDQVSGEIVTERSKQLVLFAFEDPQQEEKLLAITGAYREAFQQQAVLASYEPSCVAFH